MNQHPPSARDGRVWIVAGALLICATLVPLSGLTGLPALDYAGTALFAAALVLLALGWRGAGSITAGYRSGTVALLVLAGWHLLARFLFAIVSAGDDLDAVRDFVYVSFVIQFAAGLTAVVAIGRAKVLPAPWNWAPAWALAARVIAGIFTQIPLPADSTAIGLLEILSRLDGFVGLVVPILLGVLAIVLGVLARWNRTVHVYTGVADE